MGKDKKKQLKQLFDFVKEQYEHPDNTEFADSIRELVLKDKEVIKKYKLSSVDSESEQSSSTTGGRSIPHYTQYKGSVRKLLNKIKSQNHITIYLPSSGNIDALDNIEKYLSLDYKLDEKILPDYSFVNEDARDKLYSDFREMMRYRYGTRNHKVDFPEFCRYAGLQLEMLINYYYDNQYPNVDDVVIVIKESYPNYNPSPQPRFISEIPLKTKLYHLPKESKIGALNTTNFTDIIDIRNRQSHRSLSLNKDLIKEVEEKLKATDAWNKKYDSPDTKRTDTTNEYGKKLNKAEVVVGEDTFKEYLVQKFLDEQPYDDIIKSLQILAAKIRKSLIE